ncbi:MAG: cupin domain-containing protein [Gammaproteobacteria bacterium]|nr:cupin domain-containing protein [Gammaproteobacteria bacterium]NIM74217.1 cupin domain-containing protein [Gammaproteobacteria bacterium]NIN39516.1 cupin domain-containing protein [Gammaproteobacteria bacterium]NIO25989.1 cupin domain-containing protein [Gammaproteobacteria bacterium]NIO66622.1 cupin domain-containing protein [Gammaproteobacteria bacterium]
MNYVEIFADENGVSHFRDVEIVLTRGEVAPPALPVALSEFMPATEVGFISIPSGWVGGWHQAPSDGFIFVLSGEVQIEVGDGESRRFPAGSVWLHRDRNGPGHNSSIVSKEDAKLVIVKFPD